MIPHKVTTRNDGSMISQRKGSSSLRGQGNTYFVNSLLKITGIFIFENINVGPITGTLTKIYHSQKIDSDTY